MKRCQTFVKTKGLKVVVTGGWLVGAKKRIRGGHSSHGVAPIIKIVRG